MIHLAIDPSIVRRHLFKSWHFLTFLAARARTGRTQIYIPWIAHQEVLTGIKDQVDQLTAQSDLAKGLSQISNVAGTPEQGQELLQKLEQFRSDTLQQTVSRYKHWLRSAQADIVPLTLYQSTGAWEAYFAGEPPFRVPKSREDIPDGFILQALLEIAKAHAPLHFIVHDTKFRGECAAYPQLVAHPDIFTFCRNLSVPLDLESLREHSKLPLPISDLEQIAGRAVRKALTGLTLRIETSSAAPELLSVELVRCAHSFSLEKNSVIPLEAPDYVAAFSAKYSVQGRLKANGAPNQSPGLVSENFEISITGHVLLKFPLGAGSPATPTADIDFAEVTEICKSEDQQVVALPPKFEFQLDPWHKRELDKVTERGTTGLVVVGGSNRRNRRRVAEYIMAEKQRRDLPSELDLLGFPSEAGTSLPSIDTAANDYRYALEALFEKACAISASAVACSHEDDYWRNEPLDFATSRNAFVVMTAKGLNSVAAVVKHLNSHSRDSTHAFDNLIAVAIVTAEKGHRIKFRISTEGEWGDGSWEAILEHDDFVKQYRQR